MQATAPAYESRPAVMVKQALEGTLTLSSLQEIEKLLDIYTDNPFLYRSRADLLAGAGLGQKAIASYEKASECFLEARMNLQAIVAKILSWSLKKPTHEQGRRFFSGLRDHGWRETPLQKFFASLTYPELVAVMLRLVRIKLNTGDKLVRKNEPADNLFFIVSGQLNESVPPSARSGATRLPAAFELGANDVLGNIFPLDQPGTVSSDVTATTEVEAVKLAKPVLMDLCSKFPQIEALLRQIRKNADHDRPDRCWQTVRRSIRFGLPARVDVIGLQDRQEDVPACSTGIAVDLSRGGTCVDLSLSSVPASPQKLVGRSVKLRLDLLNDVASLDIGARLVWLREKSSRPAKTILAGFAFNDLDAIDEELLHDYCTGSIGEQNLLWSLWGSMVQEPAS